MVPFGLDREKIFIQIEKLKEHIKNINNVTVEIKKTIYYTSVIERNLQLSIEDCLNIGNHVISGLGFKRADTYKGIFKVLEENNVINKKNSQKMQELATFRNRLVHLYWEVKKEEILEKVKNLKIFEEYVKEITAYLKKQKLL